MGRFLRDKIYVIETNIDDMSPVSYEGIFERLYKGGALDVFLIPIQMKKSRPGILLTVLAEKDSLNKIVEILFRETTTFGIRYYEAGRLKLRRKKKTIKTKYGFIRINEGYLGKELIKTSPEYSDCYKISVRKKIPITKIMREFQL